MSLMPYGYYDKSYFSTMEQLNSTLSNIKTLRSSVRQIFEMLGNGSSEEELRESKFLVELQEMLLAVNGNLRDVESSISILNAPSAPFNLGNTSFLSQETTQEKQNLYSQLVNSYKWIDKVQLFLKFRIIEFKIIYFYYRSMSTVIWLLDI